MPKAFIIIFLFVAFFYSCDKEKLGLLSDSNTLPVIKLTIDEKYLWSPDSGLYIIGNNGIIGCASIVANYNQDWEHPCRIEYYENTFLVFAHNVGFRIKGRGSRCNAMKSIGLYWRSSYGYSHLNYKMFPDIEIERFKRLFLRNSGNDFGLSHIKDACVSSIHKDYSNVDYQEYKPCVVYLNGMYWGIHNIREMITPRHFQYHYGVNPDMVDLLEGPEEYPDVDDGSNVDYLIDVVDFLKNNDISNDVYYNEFINRIDVLSYIDNIIINTYICNTDWPIDNTKWWREKTSPNHTKWKWVVYDADWSMFIKNINMVYIGNLYVNKAEDNRSEGFFIFNHLINNKNFLKLFLERYMFFIDVVFEKSRVERIIKEKQEHITAEYVNHAKKWDVIGLRMWERKVNEMIDFNNKRNDIMKNIISELIDEQTE